MRVMVTGSSGKAGSYTVRELSEAGHDVVHVDRVPLPQKLRETLPGTFSLVDLGDAGEVADAFAQFRPEGVCHIAANPSPSGFPRQQTFMNNVGSTYNVMQSAGDFGVKRLVYASSEMATGWLTTPEHPKHFPFNEEDRVDTPSAYALSKYLGEKIAESMVTRYPQMSIASLRINNIIMPDGYSVLEARRKAYPEGGSTNYWSYIDVRDVAGAFRVALEGKSDGHEVFLIAAADTCIDVPFKKAFRERYGYDPDVRAGYPEHGSAFDCGKIREFFGWEPQHSWRSS